MPMTKAQLKTRKDAIKRVAVTKTKRAIMKRIWDDKRTRRLEGSTFQDRETIAFEGAYEHAGSPDHELSALPDFVLG